MGPGDFSCRGFLLIDQLVVETSHIQAKQQAYSSPWMGEGADGGGDFPDGTPTYVLPHPGGGEFSLVGFKPTHLDPPGLVLGCPEIHRSPRMPLPGGGSPR